MAAMLLGPLVSECRPGMPLEPLMRLIGLLADRGRVRALVCAAGLGLEIEATGWPDLSETCFSACRGWGA